MNIYQRINEVRKKAGFAQKDKAVQGYRAVTHDAVTALVRNELIEQGIVIAPTILNSHNEPAGTTSGGTPIIRYEARYSIEFINVDDPEDALEILVDAHANDHGDKAPGKALSYAVKNAMLKVFSIETGENDESRAEPYADRAGMTESQVEVIRDLLAESGRLERRFLIWLNADSIAEIPPSKYEQAVDALERAIKAKKEAEEQPKEETAE